MTNNHYDVIVIGAGMGGLTSALKLAACGKKVLVLEKQASPGGVASSFKRRGFLFESVLHYVDGLAPEGEIRAFLDEYGVSPKLDYIDIKEFGRIIYLEHDFIVGADFDSLEALLLNAFPNDVQGLNKFFRDIHKFYAQLDHFVKSKLFHWVKLFLSPFLYPSIIKASCLTFEQFMTCKIKDKKLRSILSTIWGFIGSPPSEMSAFYFLIVLRGCWGQKTAFIKGGFSSLFSSMVERIREYGSEVQFNTCVKEIITRGTGRVEGVRTDKGEEFFSTQVISNANAIDTLTRLIDRDVSKKIYAAEFSSMQKTISAVQVYLGLDIPLEALGMHQALLCVNTTYDHDDHFGYCRGGDYHRCNFLATSHSMFDAGFAPGGKSTLSAMTFDDYANWINLTQEEYAKKKKDFADIMVARLEKYLPGLTRHIEVVEVATPRTMERYGLSPEGSVYGFTQTVGQASLNRLSQKTRIKGLLLAGAWTQPGAGVHGCLVSGKDAADIVLRRLKHK